MELDSHAAPPGVVSRYLSLIKFSHTVFALPFALIGFFLAVRGLGAAFEWTLLAKVLLCMVTARSAAMAFNRYLDRRFDALNPRTAIREIPRGAVSPQGALLFTIICSGAFVATTAFINLICFCLSFVALAVILFYSYTKRFTALCHLVLGVGLGLAPVGAALAVTGYFHPLPVLFGLVVFTWVAGFDIIYALQDTDFDRGQRLRSIPAALGPRRALRASEALHLLSAAGIIYAGTWPVFHPLYWLGAAVFTALLVYQHRLVKPHDLSKVGIAFATTNGIASILFALLAIVSLYLKRYPI